MFIKYLTQGWFCFMESIIIGIRNKSIFSVRMNENELSFFVGSWPKLKSDRLVGRRIFGITRLLCLVWKREEKVDDQTRYTYT